MDRFQCSGCIQMERNKAFYLDKSEKYCAKPKGRAQTWPTKCQCHCPWEREGRDIGISVGSQSWKKELRFWISWKKVPMSRMTLLSWTNYKLRKEETM